MTQKSDPRIQRTQTAIRDAFMALIIEKGFDNITVRDITERAHINRATFYRHYADKHDLAARLTDILFVDVVPKLNEQLDDELENWLVLFEHVAQYATFYQAMISKNGIPEFRDRVQASVEREIQQRLEVAGYDEEQAVVPLALSLRYLAAAQVGFMQWWLENDMPFPPRQAAEYLMNLHLHGGTWGLGLVVSQ
jgi:AcrR family transcriptional regulator